MRIVVTLTLGVVLAATAAVLTQTPSPLAFEVASVRRNQSVTPAGTGIQIFPEQLDALWIPAQALVIQALEVSAGRIVGLPDWTRSERYDVRAKASRPSTTQEVRAMLQTLLATRFSLKVHRESREMDIYALVLARPDGALGPQLQRVVVNCETNTIVDGSGPGLFPRDARPPCGMMISNVRTMASGPTLMTNRFAVVTMERLASTLNSAGRPVIDKTGLTGTFDVELQYLSEGLSVSAAPVADPPDGLPRREALKRQLGLELRPDRGSVEFLVIDSIERPTPD